MQQNFSGLKNTGSTKNLNDVNSWDSTSITQFELAKVIYTSGFLQTCNLTATAKLVLMALIQHYNANNADMFPSQKFLANQLGISEKSVERAIANLRDEDYIYYVTQRVNRYRFTAHFFESVKMSVQIRQNVGSPHRQNVGQTNKEEKIKEKGNFLNFSSFGISLDKKNFRNGAKAPQKSTFEQDLENDLRQKEKENVRVLPPRRLRSLGDSQGLGNTTESGKMQDLRKQQNDNEATSPLEWSREEALKWVQSLAPVFRSRGIAKTLTQMHNYTDEELWGVPGASNESAGLQQQSVCATLQ